MENLVELFNAFWTNIQQGQLLEIGQWNYLLLSITVAVEGPIATLFGAAAASAGLMRIWAVFLAAVFGNSSADIMWYLLGRSGKINTIMRIGRHVGLKQSTLDNLKHVMEKHAVKILFFAKLTSSFMIPALVSAGLARIPIKRWLPVLLVGETIWTGSLVLIGFYTTQTITTLADKIGVLVLIVSLIFFAVIIWQGRRMILRSPKLNRAIFGEDAQNNQ